MNKSRAGGAPGLCAAPCLPLLVWEPRLFFAPGTARGPGSRCGRADGWHVCKHGPVVRESVSFLLGSVLFPFVSGHPRGSAARVCVWDASLSRGGGSAGPHLHHGVWGGGAGGGGAGEAITPAGLWEPLLLLSAQGPDGWETVSPSPASLALGEQVGAGAAGIASENPVREAKPFLSVLTASQAARHRGICCRESGCERIRCRRRLFWASRGLAAPRASGDGGGCSFLVNPEGDAAGTATATQRAPGSAPPLSQAVPQLPTRLCNPPSPRQLDLTPRPAQLF